MTGRNQITREDGILLFEHAHYRQLRNSLHVTFSECTVRCVRVLQTLSTEHATAMMYLSREQQKEWFKKKPELLILNADINQLVNKK